MSTAVPHLIASPRQGWKGHLAARGLLAAGWVALLLLSSPLAGRADAPTVIATLGGNRLPDGIGVNPVPNRIYVANWGTGTVSVIDGAGDPLAASVFLATVRVGEGPEGVGVNSSTNRIYVANWSSDTVSVIDGASNLVVAPVGVDPSLGGVGVNPVTNRIYVANWIRGTVSEIDGASNLVVAPVRVAPVVGTFSVSFHTGVLWGVGVNPTTNRVYVARPDHSVVVLATPP